MIKYLIVLCGTALQLHAADMHPLQRERVWDALHIYSEELIECLDDAIDVVLVIESDRQSKEAWMAVTNALFFARVTADLQHKLHNDESKVQLPGASYQASCKAALQCGKYGRGSKEWQEDNDKYNNGDDSIDSDDLRDIDGRGYEDSRDAGAGG